MTSESKRILELGDIIKTITPPKKIQTSEFLETGDYPIIDQSPPNVAGWTNDATALVHPPKDGLIVFGDHTCVLKFETNSFAQGADGIKIIEVKNDINPHYVYAHLKAFPLLNDGYKRHFSELKRLKILIPDSNMQDYISEVHHLVDSKIASNIALSKTLEEIAQTIFKSWFIDFDPVTAKVAGEKPVGIDAATSALFPDSLKDSELGLIPKGWVIAPIGDVLDVGGGTTPSTTNSSYWDGEHCWTTPKDLSSQIGLITTGSIRRITDSGLSQISSGLLPVNSVLMSCRAPIGYVSINAVPTAVNQGFITLKHSTEYHSLYVLNWIIANMQEINNRAGGATFAEITRKAFREIPFLKPATPVLKKYAEISEPLVMQLEQLTRQTENLQNLRDLLLPRLISGELQIPEEMLAS
jgi:type I restriction enzyme S subunit